MMNLKERFDVNEEILVFKSWFEPHLTKVIEKLPENNDAQVLIKNAASYSLLGGGKRIRAFIIAESCRHFGIDKRTVVQLMTAIELVHCYSLIHDDLPCMDNSDERRGKPSLHKKFDEATALLTGNALLSLAFDEILSESLLMESYVKMRILKSLSRAIGYHGMMAGQMLDIIISNSAHTEEFIHMNKLKTGELFSFCLSIGAIISQSNLISDFQHLGYEIGYIFQLVDDLTDVSDPNAIRFVSHLGGRQQAIEHLNMISHQAQVRAEKLCTNTSISPLIKHITNYINL